MLGLGLVAQAAWSQARNAILAVPPNVHQAEGFDPAQSTALFVGVSEFKDQGFAPVAYAVDDAVDLAYLFSMELELVKPERVVLSLAGEPKKAVSRDFLTKLLEAKAVRKPASQSDILELLDQQRPNRHSPPCRVQRHCRGQSP